MRKSLISIVAEKTNSGKLVQHLGLTYNNPIEELQLNRKNYAPIRHTDTVINGIKGTYTILSDTQRMFNNCHQLDKTYTMEKALKACEVMRKQALLNYKYSMQYFKMLSKREFDKELKRFKEAYPHFVEVTNINDYKPKRIGPREWKPYEGIYILVLKKYKQIYVGQSNRISTRIKQHWGVRAINDTEFIEHWESGVMKLSDYTNYVGANENNSIIKIDAFGPLDTSQLFIYEAYTEEERKKLEAELISFFDKKFLCNRRDETTGKVLYREEGLKAAKVKLQTKAEKRKGKRKTIEHFGVKIKDKEKSPELPKSKFTDYYEKLIKLGYTEITDLSDYTYSDGVYILVLEKFEKMFIGSSEKSIRSNVLSTWNKCKGNLLSADMDNLKISDFRPLDTTKIFVKEGGVYKTEKTALKKLIKNDVILNRR
jgi:hypothetical protein